MSSNHNNPPNPPALKDRIAVFWPIDGQFFAGVVSELTEDSKFVVHYDDGDVETLDLEKEVWKFLTPSHGALQTTQQATPPRNDASVGPAPASAPVQPPVTTTASPAAELVPPSTPLSQSKPKPSEKPQSESNGRKRGFVRRPTAADPVLATRPSAARGTTTTTTTTTTKAATVTTTAAPASRKRAPASSIKKPAPKKRNTGTDVIPMRTGQNKVDTTAAVTEVGVWVGASAGTAPAVPTAPVSAGRIVPNISTAAAPKPVSGVPVTVTYTTGQPQLARPITSGVPLSTPTPPIPPSHSPQSLLSQPSLNPQVVQTRSSEEPNFLDALQPWKASFNAQLTSQATRISNIRDMLLNLSHRLSELDERCKVLRADVDNLESEVTSRAEMHKILNGAFAKQMDELNRSQGVILERLKMDFRQFLEGEMKAVEKHLVDEIRSKSAEVFKELFRGVAESIKDTAVKSAIEDMSIATASKNSKKKGAGPSRS